MSTYMYKYSIVGVKYYNVDVGRLDRLAARLFLRPYTIHPTN